MTRIVCDADDCKNNNRPTGTCRLREIYIGKLHCQNYEMDKEYLDAQLKEKLKERVYMFPIYEGGAEGLTPVRNIDRIDTKEKLDAFYEGKLPYHEYPPAKGGEEENELPRIKAQLAEGVEPKEGETYEITDVESTKTAVQGWPAYRVGLEPTKRKTDDESKYTTMLWEGGGEVGAESKLGSFMAAFLEFYGDEDRAFDTDEWIGCTILFKSWKDRSRAIAIVTGKDA